MSAPFEELSQQPRKSQMPRKKANRKKPIESYAHADKARVNNPPVGLVTPDTDADAGRNKTWTYDQHIDPALQWAGKAEHTSFEVPTVSLHVHERIEARTIIEAVRKANGNGGMPQQPLFSSAEQNPPLREAVEFYRHRHGWSNRLVAGDSLLVMNSLLEKEGMAGKVQCVYMDPPYGIRYGSNFQPFVNQRDVKDGKDEDLTAEPEMIRAFRDTWELGIHSYLTYMRDRLLLARELLHESGSCFVQISDENVHHIREIMDEVFGAENFVTVITYTTQAAKDASNFLGNVYDFIVWYAKDIKSAISKYRQLFLPKEMGAGIGQYNRIELPDGSRRKCSREEMENPQLIPQGAKLYRLSDMCSQGSSGKEEPFLFKNKTYHPRRGTHWTTNLNGMQTLAKIGRIEISGSFPGFVRFLDDYPVTPISNIWNTLGGESRKIFVVQTSAKVIERCILMVTDPGDLVFDPTCGSGTTAHVAEQWGRRWITCDTSRVALTLAKQRLMTAVFDYYQLAYPDEGVGSGFKYKTAPHITLKSIANNEPPATETLYDQPLRDTKKARVTGPFTVEAVPAPMVKSIAEVTGKAPPPQPSPQGEKEKQETADSIARSGETLRQDEWRNELLKTGIRGKSGQRIMFSRVEPFPGEHLHAEAETRPDDSGADRVAEKAATAYQPRRVVICFGPEHAPLEQRQVERALGEAGTLRPKPAIIIFVAFQFDPEAAKDVDETDWPGMTLLKVQMNADLQTEDLRKKQRGSDSFWLVGQPDVEAHRIGEGADEGQWRVEVRGFDYFNTRTGELESGDQKQIAVWMLDTDYDGRSLYPKQVFFPMAGNKDGWSKLAKSLKAEIDQDLIKNYHGVTSLPFEPGEHKRIAVKIVDDRGVESLRVVSL